MTDGLLIYGATGFTGQLLTDRAIRCGLRPVLAGRDPTRVAAAATRFGCEGRVAGLNDPAALDAALDGIAVVVHVAGPFADTAVPMVDACLRAGAHYLDLSGEVETFEALSRRHAEAARRGVMLLPGVGFDVVASDCLAVHVARRLGGRVQTLAIASTGFSTASRGSAHTLLRHAGHDVCRRQGGRLVSIPPGVLQRPVDFGEGPRTGVNVAWADLVAAHHSTGASDIDTFVEATPAVVGLLALSRTFAPLWRTATWAAVARSVADTLPEHPAGGAPGPMRVMVEGGAPDGTTARARLETPAAYEFSAVAAVAAARRVLHGDVVPGFETPGRLFGPDFVLDLPGVTRTDLH